MAEQVRFTTVMTDYIPFIEALSSSFRECYRDDLRQEGLCGLYSACLTFDRTKGVPFDAYAKTCIKNRMLYAYRNMSKDAGAMNLDEAYIPSSTTDVTSRLYAENFFRKLRTNLSATESSVLDAYLKELSYEQIAKELGLSEKTVDNAILRIRKKIKKYYNIEDL